ncbi:hypothetical protein O3M35_012911 [Rhynocoris fuscipes]|uniref:Uncharacterized protein n=1 Tax=Rhynocoris fuscipes TaxID=488301 RepID=A0AAW1CHA3_9HEMI
MLDGSETAGFVVALASICIIVLAVIAVYLRKKLTTQYGLDIKFSCCDKGPSSGNEVSTLGEAFSVSEIESSTDSDEEVLNKFKNSVPFRQNSTNFNHFNIVVMGEDPVFDMSEKRTGHDGIGALQLSLAYDQPTRNLTLHLLQGTDMPALPAHIQVRAVLLPP